MKGELDQDLSESVPNESGSSSRKRKLEKKWTANEDKTMVAMIEQREAIWNTCSPLYRNRDVKSKSWFEISECVGHSIPDAKNRWNIIKSRFNCERNKELECEIGNYHSKYELYKPLQFLSKIPKKPIKNDQKKQATKIEFHTCYESSQSPATLYYSNPFDSNFENLDAESTYESDTNEMHENSKIYKTSPSLQSTSSNTHNQRSRLNEESRFLQTSLKVSDDNRWKKVFAEYIHCELERYQYNDAQRLKNQLTRVCLDFQPTAEHEQCCYNRSYFEGDIK